jgi:hypothetical protein
MLDNVRAADLAGSPGSPGSSTRSMARCRYGEGSGLYVAPIFGDLDRAKAAEGKALGLKVLP